MQYSTEVTLEMDTADDQEVSVTASRDRVVLADTTQIPYRRIYLTPFEARKLAEFLTEQAVAAEAYDA